MKNNFSVKDYISIKELLNYPAKLDQRLSFFDDTSSIEIPKDPIEKVIFQNRAKAAIRKVAQNKGHILMVGRPGTGKSMLANMFNEVLDRSLGDYLRPKDAIVAFPGKDNNHIKIAYESPEKIDKTLDNINRAIDVAKNSVDEFSLSEQIQAVRKVKHFFIAGALLSLIAGFFLPAAFIITSLAGIGAIFMFIQENNHKVQEKIQRESQNGVKISVKPLQDMVPEILYDPRKDTKLMACISEPDTKKMKGGFRHDPYQSGNLHTPAHKRAYLGAHAKSPVIYIDELKSLIRAHYMPNLLEIMQNKEFVLEGGRNSGSGSADRSETPVKADNIIVACCNHDTLAYLQEEGDGAFLSRIEDKGEIIQMESCVPETQETISQVAQYIKQEVINLGKDFEHTWGKVIELEGYDGVRKRSQHIFGKPLPPDYTLKEREFTKNAVAEIIKELRCRAGDGKLSGILRPINGVIKTAELEAILENSEYVTEKHVQHALTEHVSLEGALYKELIESKKDLKRYISSLTDSIGYVVGLAVIQSKASGQMYGQPLPIRCQVISGSADTVVAPGKMGDIAKAAAQNVRASIKKSLRRIGALYGGYEMHIEYIQAHGGVEGDSASIAMDIGLISDYIKQPVNQRFGITGSLTGDIILAVGGVTEKVRSIMDIGLGMEGACVPWQNRTDIEPLLINKHTEYIQKDTVPGVRIYRSEDMGHPFDIYFCKTKFDAYRILMDISQDEVEARMIESSKRDLELLHQVRESFQKKCA